ncbi:MAG: ATP-binding protein, partial [Cyanobacteria bacterium J06576_12]
DLSFDERLALLVEREHLRRHQQRLTRRLKQAKLFVGASLAEVDYHVSRAMPAVHQSSDHGKWVEFVALARLQ